MSYFPIALRNTPEVIHENIIEILCRIIGCIVRMGTRTANVYIWKMEYDCRMRLETELNWQLREGKKSQYDPFWTYTKSDASFQQIILVSYQEISGVIYFFLINLFYHVSVKHSSNFKS